MNTDISLHKPPNTSQNIYPINSHWSTSHVNYLMDSAAENANGFLLDSKDAKCIVCGDIAPVLKPGKSWSNFETPDHSFDQSRVNAVTPMTHLFMDMPNVDLIIPGSETVVNVTRSGKAHARIILSKKRPENLSTFLWPPYWPPNWAIGGLGKSLKKGPLRLLGSSERGKIGIIKTNNS